MKIAEIVAVFPPYPGGTGFVCLQNARALAKRGHQVTVFTLDYGRLPLNDSAFEFEVVRLRTPVIFWGGGIVPQLFSRLKGFDVIHLHYPFFGGAEYVFLASRVRGQQYLLTYHMDTPGDTFLKKWIVKAYDALFFKRILTQAARIGAVSLAHFRSSRAASCTPEERVAETYNGVDTAIFVPGPKDEVLIDRLRLQEKIVLLFVGHLIPLKGLPVLLDALALLNRADIILLVVGAGHKEANYRQLVKDKGLDSCVTFAGYQTHDQDLPKYYNTADIFILPSIQIESFGMVVLEAMACAKPVIVSSLPGPMFLVRDGVDGLVSRAGDAQDLRDKIEILANDSLRRTTMGAAARQKVIERYSWTSIGEKLEAILAEIAEKK